MKKIAKAAAAVLSLCMLFAVCGCYTSNVLEVTESVATAPQEYTYNYQTNPDAPQPGTSAVPPETVLTDATLPTADPQTPATAPSETDTTQPVPSSTEPPTESTAAPTESTAAPTTEAPTAADPAAWSKQEVLSYLTQAINHTKEYTGNITVDRSEELGINIETISPNLPALKDIANSLVSKFIKPVDEVVQFSGGKGTSDGEEIPLLLPKRQIFTLPIDGVKTASASKNGENIVIDITLVEESSSMSNPPKYNSQAMGYLDVNSVDLSMVTISTLDFTYLGSTIHAVIRPDGYVQSAKYHIPLKVSASGKAVGIPGAFTGTGYQTETWELHW